MKRLYLILIALSGPLTIGACETIPPAEVNLETHIDINIGNDGRKESGGSSFGIGGGNEPTLHDEYLDFELIMPLNETVTVSSQGGDCWGDYFFQFGANYNKVEVYDLSLKTHVQTIYIQDRQKGFVPNCHANTACFGTEYYAPGDLFPLIYVSTGNASDGYTGALVYRITRNAVGQFSISLVQTLKFPDIGTAWTEFIPAGDCAYLCYPGKRIIYKVSMPKLKDGDMVVDPASALETYQFSPQPEQMGSSSNQDRLFLDGKIVFVTGSQPGQFTGLVVLNLEERERERIFDFKKNGLTSEPESIFVWQGDLCVAFKDKVVRLIF